MAEEQRPGVEISDTDFQALAAKLKDFYGSLPPSEQVILGLMLEKVLPSPEDTQGFQDDPWGWFWNFFRPAPIVAYPTVHHDVGGFKPRY